ncbi:MAG: hypothetical protein U0N32_00350 [Oscillospiraceae bacterium]
MINRSNDGKQRVLSLSYGKDSLACLGAIEQLGLPLDRIIHAEVWATDTIPADLPEMVEFKEKADAIIKDRYGIEVEHISSEVSYEEQFYKRRFNKKKEIDCIYGFPCIRGAWCNDRLKTGLLNKINKGNICYIGIASDEPNRFHNLTDEKISPLVEAGWAEDMCREWCIKNDLLSPIYTTATRGGCWFCHNQSISQLRLLRKNYPELWRLLLKWDTDSPVSFKPDGHTVHDFDIRFRIEDEGLIDPKATFRWSMLDDDLQYTIFKD